MSTDQIKSAPLGELVDRAVNARLAADYCSEIRRRLVANPGLKDLISQAERQPKSEWRDDRPARDIPLGSQARVMLDSRWDFSGLRDKSPDQVRVFVTGIAESNVPESMLSDGQLGYWRAIVGKYRSWAGLTSPAFQN